MPRSHESSEFEFSNENQPNILNRNLSSSKKFRHQNYSKNIYIGTRNAEKWETIRTKLSFKNDVEFVSYLLKLAENDLAENNGNNKTNFSGLLLDPSQTSNEKSSKISNENTNSESVFHLASQQKKSKKVQFQDGLNGIVRNCIERSDQISSSLSSPTTIIPNDEQALDSGCRGEKSIFNTSSLCHSTASDASDFPNAQEENTSEVLDCRIAEKIKTELCELQTKEKLLSLSNSKEDINQPMNNENDYDDVDDEEDDSDDGEEAEEALCLAAIKKRDSENRIKPNTSSCLDIALTKLEKVKKRKTKYDEKCFELPNKNIKSRRGRRKIKHDIRKAPQGGKITFLETSNNSNSMFHQQSSHKPAQNIPDDDEDEEQSENQTENADEDSNSDLDGDPLSSISKNPNCSYCDLQHTTEECPVRNSDQEISDAVERISWLEQNKEVAEEYAKQHVVAIKTEDEDDDDVGGSGGGDIGDDDDDEENLESNSSSSLIEESVNNVNMPKDNLPTFADASLPNIFEYRTHLEYGQTVFAKSLIAKYTKLGPLIGTIVPATDIADDCNMRYIIELFDGTKSIFISTENKNESNWLRYIRPAACREDRNLSVVCLDEKVYFITCTDINEGCELLYWSDDINSAWGKKKIEKMNCGGCNLKFDHPLFYRTHCSVFHDPVFSLTIRKYHCKVCGIAVLGKENIMKHAAQMHEGKGAYQCQYCKKFFLRLNYLEMHRTYGCSANPQRARPLCDFCGRKFCQPQKLKVHIKRMHSDMADVLRDFQCKLCSKLLGSRAALQRHSKEVHSRNSAVVSCPRCQKLFQNRSNLKIHMLTHSGVRPFKCAENECNAAFTTKQCLQFHYKKVHGYTQDQMPKIERSIAYTFDAYSGGMKVDFLAEQVPRRRRKSLDEQSLLMAHSYPEKKKYSKHFKEEDFLMQSSPSHKTSITDLCKSETNLSLLSSKISSLLNQELTQVKFRRKSSCIADINDDFDQNDIHKNENDKNFQNKNIASINNIQGKSKIDDDEEDDDEDDEDDENEDKSRDSLDDVQGHQQHNAQLNLVESFLSSSAVSPDQQPNPLQALQSQMNEQQHPEERLSYNLSSNPRLKDFATPMNQHLIASKGSKKWINDQHRVDDQQQPPQQQTHQENNMMVVNRDFITRLMMNGSNTNNDEGDEDDDSSTILDVVDNHPQNSQAYEMQQMHLSNLPMSSHMHHQPFMSSFYNNNNTSNSRIPPGSATSTSASMLVEAALSSVSNMIDGENENCNMGKGNTGNRIEEEHELNSHMDVDIDSIPNEHNHLDGNSGLNMSDNSYHAHNNISPLDNETKLMKTLNSFQMTNMQQFPQPSTTTNNQIIQMSSPSVNSNGNELIPENEIDVDTASTPHTLDPSESTAFRNYHQNSSPSPRNISPGHDYRASLYSANNHVSPSHTIPRRNYHTEADLISPSSSPPLPRYDFSNETCRKREQDQVSIIGNHNSLERRDSHHLGHLSSDEDSIVIAQNLSVNNNNNDDMKMKMNPSLDLLYAKYETGNSGQELSDLRMKYNSNEHTIDVSDFRSNNASEPLSEIQGLDMSSRGGISGYSHHNFQLSSTTGTNLSLNRYHHHIYDILSEREQQQQSDHHQLQLQQQQQIQHMLQDQMASEQEQDQTTSVDLSRTTSYVVTSPTALPYSHPHPDMLRMVSLELNANGTPGMLVGNNSHHGHGRSFLPSQIQHNSRDSLSAVDHHRLLSSAEQHRLLASNTAAAAEQLSNPSALTSNHRLLVDPAAHLLMEPNNRLLSSENNRLLDQTSRILADSSVNRHMVPSRDFGAYHHQVTSNNYHHLVRPGLTSPNHHTNNPSNYHPFPAYY